MIAHAHQRPDAAKYHFVSTYRPGGDRERPMDEVQGGWSRRAFLGAGVLAALEPCSGGAVSELRSADLLQAQGNRLVYGGREVRLRGVAIGDPLLARPDRPTSDFRVLAGTWRCNLVRISVHPGTWRDRRAEALRLLERDVAAALANRMWVVIDWHAMGWPDAFSQGPDYDSRWSLARSFWREMARRFGNDGRVVFELWNEPAFDRLGGPRRWRWPALRARYEELIALVRANGPNLVLLGGDRWAYDLRGIRTAPAWGRNIGYSWHIYAGHDGNDPAAWVGKLDDLDRHHPVLVTEWGFCRSCVGAHYWGTPASFGQPFMQRFLNGRGLSWTAWVWHPLWQPALIEADWRTPTEFGRFVLASLTQGPSQRP